MGKKAKEVTLVLGLLALAAPLAGGERRQSFDKDPGWEGRNNRAATEPRTIVQDFGYSSTAHAKGKPGEMGGMITPAAEPCYYARKIAPRTFRDRLSASGVLNCQGRHFHALLGFFNADTINEWRTPNSIALRLYGRGDVFYAYVEYATAKWRAGGDSPQPFPMEKDPETGREKFRGFASGETAHRFTLDYDPQANQGQGAITVTMGGHTAICNLGQGHKSDGAMFNRFGLLGVVKSADTGGELWVDDLVVNGESESFDRDPGWEGLQNRRTYTTLNVRPRFDFGHSPTRHAGGKAAGELGGLVFRGDIAHPDKMASYGDRVGPLRLDKPLRASGRVALRRGVSDSTSLIGFFNSTKSTALPGGSSASGFPMSFLGVSIEGPSSEGFLFYPAFRLEGDAQNGSRSDHPPPLLPDGAQHAWSLEYSPPTPRRRASIRVTLDGRSTTLELNPDPGAASARFDRFGIVTTWIDGNGQLVYFDDLTYTASQD